MEKEPKVTACFEEVGKKDIALAGGKGANLGELTNAGIPVPPGFIVTSETYFYFLEKAKLGVEIKRILEAIHSSAPRTFQAAGSQIKELIGRAPMPREIAEKIRQEYRKLGGGLVAVRSSATAEDLPDASFAGQQRTFLNIEGEEEVIAAVQGCWASLFEPRAIFYRIQQGFDHLKVGIAVPVQRMVQSEVAGVVFTVEPLTNDSNKIVIEAGYGLGEAMVSGEITPDLYILDKNELKILEKKVNKQEWKLVRAPCSKEGGEKNIRVAIPEPDQVRQKLTDKEIVALANWAKAIEDLYQVPQDIEWAKEQDRFHILQARPITALKKRHEVEEGEIKGKLLLSGFPASPGIAAGPVRAVLQTSEVDRVESGDVLVAEMTTPDFVPAMKRAVAILTERGGRTCHAAIVSRELGIPCVVGASDATKIVQERQKITVDGFRGKVYDGMVTVKGEGAPSLVRERIKTNTRVYVNLADPDSAKRVAARDVDGVGLLRAEFIITHIIGQHPLHMLEQGRGQKFIDQLAEGIETIAQAFAPRPVVYRTTDFKTNEYRGLKGGDKYEGLEENPMLGYRGCSRYIREIAAFRLELEAIKKVREKFPNLWVMLPFVRTVKELAETKNIMQSEGLSQSPDFKLWMMVEVPSNVILLEKFLDVGIDGVSIGSNDLTQLILGIDRDSSKLAADFDERDEAVLLSLEKVIKTAKVRGVTCSICGQAPSVYPELTRKLVSWGITSVSVSPDMIEQTREIIAEAEKVLA